MADRPNILWIVTTQWRASALGYAGDPNARTPQLDTLAAAGVNYAQAVTPHPFGPFARAALLTGVESPANGVRDYFDPLPLDARTIAHELGERGYATAWFGKWHLAARDPAVPLVGEAHARMIVPAAERGGFEFWEGFESGFLLNDPWLHGTRLPAPQRMSGYQSDVLCVRAAEWLADPANRRSQNVASPRPWFAVVSLEAPHPPYDAPADDIRRMAPEHVQLPANVPRGGEVEAKARHELAGYYAHIAATDRSLGRLITAVDAEAGRRGERRPVIVFTSVHGDMHGAHGLFRKGWPQEESVRVPLLIRGAPPDDGRPTAGGGSPMIDRGGRRSDELVSLLDLPAMACAWAEGRVWRCERDHATISMPSVVRLPHQCDRVWRGVRTATSKRVDNADGSPWLRFDLAKDPLEMNNLAVP